MKSLLRKIEERELANFKFLISNFYSISNVSMFKFLKRVAVTSRNLDIKNSLEISNLKLEIESFLNNGVRFRSNLNMINS